MGSGAREAAFKALLGFDRDGAYINSALNSAMRGLDGRDRAFATELCYGCLKNRALLDYIISRFSKIRIKKMSHQVRIILELGAYQIMMTYRIPDSAACDESVKLAKKYANRSRGFVNGVLRGLCRGKEGIAYPERGDGEAEYLSLMFSFPLWTVKRLIDDYGAEECEKILAAANRAYPPYIRENRLKKTDGFVKALEDDGIKAEPDGIIEGCYKIIGALDIAESDTYKNGLFTVQNRSSQLAAITLDPKPGMLAVDMCAAPGGKTTHMAELMENRGEIRAFDVHEHKIALIEAAAKRLGIDIIKAETRDAAEPVEDLIGKADRVLLDAPCSGLGVTHSKPDIRLRRKEEDIAELIEIQRGLLSAGALYVKPGGVLVYSTCTLLKAENGGQIKEFLKSRDDFELVSEQTLMTHETGGSGFYIAKLLRK